MPTIQEEAKAVFDQALEFENAAERQAFLARQFDVSPHLRTEVEGLLSAFNRAGSFLDKPPAGLVPTVSGSVKELPVKEIGPYKLREQIGEGGFGVVYVAEQTQPVRRKVALKLIKPGMDTKEVVARFEAERQALALLDHPNISKVLDAGTTESSRPYFVMELVHGVPITDFCDKNRLSIRDRLGLFMEVCHAVHHAHLRGIIHRDLKPSNILVTLHDGRPVPKVIDFGVAKALNQQLTEKTVYTSYGQVIGTPQYMSPEQAEMSGLGIDTRSDIYSLGVLLYELLTGAPPVDRKRLLSSGYAEMIRIIREEEPPRPSKRVSTLGHEATVIAKQRSIEPSQLTRDLHGDLDWIVMKTLEKERERRYETVRDLVNDLQRHIDDQPVVARPPSVSYRVQKYMRRHRLLVGAATSIVLVLGISTVVSTIFAVREYRASTRAVKAKESADTARDAAEKEKQAKERALTSEQQVSAELSRKSQELEKQVYEANIHLADAAWADHDLPQARSSLQTCPPHLRDWEWSRLSLLAKKKWQMEVVNAQFCNDSSSILTPGEPNVLEIRDVETGQVKRSLKVAGLTRIGAASPTEPHVLVWQRIENEDYRCLLDWETGKIIWHRPLGGHDSHGLAFSPDGKQIISAGRDNRIFGWRANSGEQIFEQGPFESDFRDVSYHPSGDYFATCFRARGDIRARGDNGRVQVRDANTGELFEEYSHFNRPPQSCAFNHAGNRLVSVGYDGRAVVRQFPGGQILDYLPERVAAFTARFSPDDSLLALGGRASVRLYDTSDWGLITELAADFEDIWTVDFSPDQRKLIAFGFRRNRSSGGKLFDLDVALRPDIFHCGGNELEGRALGISPDGRLLAVGGMGRSIRVLNADTGECLRCFYGHPSEVESVTWSITGKQVYSLDSSGRLFAWDLDQSDPVWKLRLSAGDPLANDNRHAISITPNAKHLVVGTQDGELIVLDPADGAIQNRRQSHRGVINGVACSPDGHWFASAGEDQHVIVYDAETCTPQLTFEAHHGYVKTIQFSPNSSCLISASHDSVRIWDRKSGQENISPIRASNYGFRKAVFSRSGKRFFAAESSGIVTVFDVASGRELFQWWNSGGLWSFGMSAETARFVSTSPRGGISIADIDDVDLQALQAREVTTSARRQILNLPDSLIMSDAKIDFINRDTTLSRDIREASLKSLMVHGDDPYVLNRESWKIVTQSASDQEYRSALRWAQRACDIVPECADYNLSKALAQFRVGDYEESIETVQSALSLSDLNVRLGLDKFVTDLRPLLMATMAMAQHQIGKDDHAAANLQLAIDDSSQANEFNKAAQSVLLEAKLLMSQEPDAGDEGSATAKGS